MMELISQKSAWLCFLCLYSTTLASFIIPLDIDIRDDLTKTEVDLMKNNLRRKLRLNLRRYPLTISDDNLIEGDILPDNLLIPEQPRTQGVQGKISVSTPTRLWPDGIVPYTFSGHYAFNAWERNKIKQTMDDMEKRSCIKFVERTTEQDYVKFINDRNRCYSQIGRRGGIQYVSLGFKCKLWKRTAAYHELLHVLGFFHEHTRPDRDEHVEIIWKHIKPREKKNFGKRPWYEINVDTPYDIESVMHYGPYTFSISPSTKPTMKHKRYGIEYPRRNTPSKMDYEKLNRLYVCYGHGHDGYSELGYVGPSLEYLKEHRLPLLYPINKDLTHHTHRPSDEASISSNTGNIVPGFRLPGFREAIKIRQIITQKTSMRDFRILAQPLVKAVPKLLPPPSPSVQSPTISNHVRKIILRHRNNNADTMTSRKRPFIRELDRPRPNEST